MTYHERFPLTTLAGETRSDPRSILVDFTIAIDIRNAERKTEHTWPDLSDIYTETIERLRESLCATEFRPISEAEWQAGLRDATALTSMSEQDWIDIEEAE